MRHRSPFTNALLYGLLGLMLVLVFGAQAQDALVYRVGVLGDPFGPLANGARLAAQEINDQGGIRAANGTLYRLELVVEDVGPQQSLEAAVIALDQLDVVAAIGPADAVLIADGLTTLQSLNVPVLIPVAEDTLLASDLTRRLFRVVAADVWRGRALAHYLITTLETENIATVQLNPEDIAAVVGFSTAANVLGVEPDPLVLFSAGMTEQRLVEQVLQLDSEAVVIYGPPERAASVYNTLIAAGWEGLFAYPDALDPAFTLLVEPGDLTGVVATTSWTYTYADPASTAFELAYMRTYGLVPTELAAAGYDAVRLLAAGLVLPGQLVSNLGGLDEVPGVQGPLRPANFTAGDTLSDVGVVQINPFGAPIVLARYRDNTLIAALPGDTPIATLVPPLGNVFITITGERQNVRSGPGLQYDILGNLERGAQAQVIGTTEDNTWVVIDFQGQQGWLAAYLLEVTGDLSTVPVIQPPPTPTPLPATPTPIPPPEADLIIESVTLLPQPIVPGEPFTGTVLIRNQGNTPTGPFVISVTFPPNNTAVTSIANALAPGQTTVVNLQGLLVNTGFYTAGVVVDANNQVPEGIIGEQNNLYNVTYQVDVPIMAQGTQTLNLGETIDVEDNAIQGDANWNADGGLALDAIFGARLGILPAVDMNQVHWDLVNPAIINRESIPRAELAPGMIIGMITADQHRAVLRVDAVSDTQLTLSYKTYRR